MTVRNSCLLRPTFIFCRLLSFSERSSDAWGYVGEGSRGGDEEGAGPLGGFGGASGELCRECSVNTQCLLKFNIMLFKRPCLTYDQYQYRQNLTRIRRQPILQTPLEGVNIFGNGIVKTV